MFDMVFSWRKASKCKKLIRRALKRLEMLKKKRYSIVRQLREDLTELINNGYQQIAFNRVEQVIKDESLMDTYELIERFCEFILVKLSYIRKRKNCPDDVIEAISSLIFASARCGDFPELKLIREFFGEWYGQSFAMAAVELYPGNLVNPQIKEKLSMMLVSDDEKQGLINEIARDCFHPAILALEYCPDWHQEQVLDNGVQTVFERIEAAKIQDSYAAELEREVICVKSSLVSGNFSSTQCYSTSSSYLVGQSTPNLEKMTVEKELGEVSSNSELASSGLLTVSSWKAEECQSTGWNEAASLGDMFAGEDDASSNERLPPFSDETIIYLDDIVELQNSTTKNGDFQDHRLFKFKSPVTTKREHVEDGYNQSSKEHHENWNKTSDLERLSKSRNESRKALRRVSTRREKQRIRDIECASYYGEPTKNSSTHKHASKNQRKHQKNVLTEEKCSLSQTKKTLMKCCCRSCHSCSLTSEMENCSLEQPCYVYSDSNMDDFAAVKSEEKKVHSYFIRSPAHNHLESNFSGKDFNYHKDHILWTGVLVKEVESNTFPKTQKRNSCEIGTMVYDVFIYSQHPPEENKETNKKPEEFSTVDKYECSLGSYEMEDDSTKHTKAAALQIQQSEDDQKEEIFCSNSFPNKYPSHVHPNLPDYDEIAAKFMALRRENLHKKHHQSGN